MPSRSQKLAEYIQEWYVNFNTLKKIKFKLYIKQYFLKLGSRIPRGTQDPFRELVKSKLHS